MSNPIIGWAACTVLLRGYPIGKVGSGGQAWYSPLAILTALTLKAVFRLALRQAEGLIGSIISLLGLALAVPDHSTLSRRAESCCSQFVTRYRTVGILWRRL